jgi:hypothetical protein
LQPRREIWSFTDGSLRISVPIYDSANNGYARRDSDARVERTGRASGAAQMMNGLDRKQAAPHRALGVVLVCEWVAKICEYTITNVAGDMSSIFRN